MTYFQAPDLVDEVLRDDDEDDSAIPLSPRGRKRDYTESNSLIDSVESSPSRLASNAEPLDRSYSQKD